MAGDKSLVKPEGNMLSLFSAHENSEPSHERSYDTLVSSDGEPD